jgi:glycosyltransferase involved in cell wall biosynthesis
MKPTQFLSIVIPVYNDEDVLDELNRRLIPVAEAIAEDFEVIFIDDGSKDRSWKILVQLQKSNPKLKIIKLARNFGQSNSTAAGLDHAKGDIIVIMDSDLQDRPEDIPKLIDSMEENDMDMAIVKWISRKDSFSKKFVSRFFHTVSDRITNLHYEPGLGVFRAIRKSALDQIKNIPETTGTTLSLMYWAGFEYSIVELQRDARYAGASGYNLRKMLKLAADRIFSYSLFPIRVASYVGLTVGGLSFVFGILLIIKRLLNSNIPAGWTSTLVLLAFLFGINFFFLGIIGEYLGRIYLETKGRPKYTISRIIESSTSRKN